jgi:hypothetical protein
VARALIVMIVLVGVVAPETGAVLGGDLRSYVVAIRPEIRSYKADALRLSRLLTSEPVTNVDPLVDDLGHVAVRFDGLRRTWVSITAPRGLRLRHVGMARVFDLFADATRIYAAAVSTRHLEEIQAAGPKLSARLRSAAYLQKRWAAALRGALIRANIAVPRWLLQMATA